MPHDPETREQAWRTKVALLTESLAVTREEIRKIEGDPALESVATALHQVAALVIEIGDDIRDWRASQDEFARALGELDARRDRAADGRGVRPPHVNRKRRK